METVFYKKVLLLQKFWNLNKQRKDSDRSLLPTGLNFKSNWVYRIELQSQRDMHPEFIQIA